MNEMKKQKMLFLWILIFGTLVSLGGCGVEGNIYVASNLAGATNEVDNLETEPSSTAREAEPVETEPLSTEVSTTVPNVTEPDPSPVEIAQLLLTNSPLDWTAVEVTRIIDGDTIEVMYDGQRERVRFIGVDAPERGEEGFIEATDFVRDEIANVGDVVFLQASGNNRDRFQRLRRYIWLGVPTDKYDETERSDLLLNQMLLDEELAVEMIIGGETAPTQPPATQAPTVAPTQPPATQAPTVAPTEPPVEETPTTVISIQAPNQARRGERINITLSGAGSQGTFTLHMRTPSGGGSNAGDFNNGNKILQANQNGSVTFEFMIGTNSTIGGVFTLTVNGATHTITVVE